MPHNVRRRLALHAFVYATRCFVPPDTKGLGYLQLVGQMLTRLRQGQKQWQWQWQWQIMNLLSRLFQKVLSLPSVTKGDESSKARGHRFDLERALD